MNTFKKVMIMFILTVGVVFVLTACGESQAKDTNKHEDDVVKSDETTSSVGNQSYTGIASKMMNQYKHKDKTILDDEKDEEDSESTDSEDEKDKTTKDKDGHETSKKDNTVTNKNKGSTTKQKEQSNSNHTTNSSHLSGSSHKTDNSKSSGSGSKVSSNSGHKSTGSKTGNKGDIGSSGSTGNSGGGSKTTGSKDNKGSSSGKNNNQTKPDSKPKHEKPMEEKPKNEGNNNKKPDKEPEKEEGKICYSGNRRSFEENAISYINDFRKKNGTSESSRAPVSIDENMMAYAQGISEKRMGNRERWNFNMSELVYAGNLAFSPYRWTPKEVTDLMTSPKNNKAILINSSHARVGFGISSDGCYATFVIDPKPK